MAFEKTVPEWNAAGAEPPSALKNSGFTAGYKPPADYFNWFWHGVSQVLVELQQKAVESGDIIPIAHGGTGASTKNGAVNNLFTNTSITAGNPVDANTITAIGIYRFYFANGEDFSGINIPTQYGIMFVFGYSSYVIQVFVDVSGNKFYYRATTNNGTSWKDWKMAATISDIELEYAALEHKHSADDITSGTVPIARGGTGGGNANDAVKNLLIKSLINDDNPVDANTLTAIGIYRYYIANADTDYAIYNIPARYGDMFVFGAGSYVVQLYFDMASSRQYFRITANGGSTWNGWNRVATLNSSGAVSVSEGGTGATDAATARINLGITPANIGAAAANHNQAASTITAGTFAGAVVAKNDTAYTTYKVRNGAFLSAVPTSMTNGTYALVYS